MPIINARGNENNRRKGNAKIKKPKKSKDRKEQGLTEAIVKGWELNGFVAYLSSPINM